MEELAFIRRGRGVPNFGKTLTRFLKKKKKRKKRRSRYTLPSDENT